MLPALLLLAAFFLSNAATGLAACTASDIVAQDAGCPASGPCTVTRSFTIDNGCSLDFGARALTISASGTLAVGAGTVTIRAASLTMNPGAFIDARSSSGAGVGGSVTIVTTGHVAVQRSGSTRARIDASANVRAGTIRIEAGGRIDIAGRLLALQLTSAGTGGAVELIAGGDLTSETASEITATGGMYSPLGGGRVEMTAGGMINLGSEVNVTGSSGGNIRLASAGALTVRGLRGNGNGESGAGGSVSLSAFRDVQILAPILVNGSSLLAGEGGEGGTVGIEVGYGDLLVADDILAEGAAPDGDGGEIDLFANGSITVASGAPISVRCNGAYGLGGTIEINATTHITSSARIDVSGGGNGGEIGMGAGGDITLTAVVDARGRFEEGTGGEIAISAGLNGSGALSVRSDIDAGGGACNLFGCGEGGDIELLACGLTVTSTGRVLARAPGVGGKLRLSARSQLRIDGTVSAARTLTSGTDGTIALAHPAGTAPVLRTGGVAPTPQISALPLCIPNGDPACLMPCPTCGNGVIEYPEDCDDGNAVACDGCSSFCVTDVCDPAALCATLCDPRIGCPPLPPTPCAAPPTPTAIATATPSSTLPPGAPTYTASSTRSASSTATATPLRTSTPTSTASPTVTQTRTPTATPASRYDAVLSVPRPMNIALKDGQPASKTLRVRVANGARQDPAMRPIRLRAEEGDCPAGTIEGAPDFDPIAGGSQDTVELGGGKVAYAQITVRADSLAYQPINRRSPQRCTLILQADVPLPANQDPTPDNNLAFVEINVTSDTLRAADPHQTAIQSAAPVTLRIPRRKGSVQRRLIVAVSNADRNDVAGHAITLEASDGNCPTGTIGTPVFHRPNALPINNVAVGNLKTRRGSVAVEVTAVDFPGGTRHAPRRCNALLVATGPSGDADPSNNVTLLPIDVISE